MDTPKSLAEKHMKLAGEYAHTSGLLEDILKRKPALWLSLRENATSDKAADRAYEATEDGINETGLRLRLKAIEKQIGAIKSMLSVMEGEARSQF
jgi:hypothetical protein